ncbi:MULTISPECIES: zf-HC2 domain-containing protein [Streptomyces]|uniref:Zf-HC2 domain-containing protein n=2 Tax=Streptomyces TaxID=1883 RepID=A0ABW6Z2K7_9ACTN|nr:MULTISPECIES: zf-HC2 domain-containing protein [Streptomyces]MCL3996300.1 zf-HC2 domain-containing protein [Streptomyces lavenduligriseus]QIS73025.1 zf-HC2 domain-containing protein [Streptomyces sp. DSM 40868]WDM13502.1 zf-HC2 domain-containing protein [Streptomyces lavenduligriseus]
MSGSRSKPAEEAHLAEQHLGDRLSALVDGELGHETRERVLAHLATCARCKAEADAQRALKNVFAEAAPPPPSASLLARLQGLPGGDPDGGGTPSPGPGPGASGGLGPFGARRGDRLPFGYVPARPHGLLPTGADGAGGPRDDGFRIHPVGRPDDARTASRGRRFAFAAAGAVSLAALALGGVTTGFPGDPATEARGGSGVIPVRSAGTGGGAATPDSQRRRPVGPLLAQGGALLGSAPVAPTTLSAPLLPGVPAPASGQARAEAVRALTAPVFAGAAAVSSLIRPLDETVALPLTDWPKPPGATGSGPLPAPVPDTTPSSVTASPHPSP